MLTQTSFPHFTRQWVVALLIVAFVVGPVVPPASAAKGGNDFKAGQKAEATGDYDAAVAFYDRAYASDIKNPQYQAALRRARFVAAMRHVDAGHKLRDQQKLDEALKEFQIGQALDPSTAIAEQEISRTMQMIEA